MSFVGSSARNERRHAVERDAASRRCTFTSVIHHHRSKLCSGAGVCWWRGDHDRRRRERRLPGSAQAIPLVLRCSVNNRIREAVLAAMNVTVNSQSAGTSSPTESACSATAGPGRRANGPALPFGNLLVPNIASVAGGPNSVAIINYIGTSDAVHRDSGSAQTTARASGIS